MTISSKTGLITVIISNTVAIVGETRFDDVMKIIVEIKGKQNRHLVGGELCVATQAILLSSISVKVVDVKNLTGVSD